MREHPIPQDITGYRFHIIGSMTLKQFAELATGAILGLIIYATNLPDVFKWPLIFLVVALGAGAAFLPFEERPLDHWISTFIKVMYKPTKFFWKRSQKIPAALLYEPGKIADTADLDLDLGPARRQRIKEYLASVEQMTGESDFDQETNLRLQEIMRAFETVMPGQVGEGKQTQKPQLKVRVRSLQLLDEDEETTPPIEQTTSAPTTKLYLSPTQVAKQIDVPAEIAVTIEDEEQQQLEEEAAAPTNEAAYLEPTLAAAGEQVDQQATLNAALPFPSKPDEPNKLVGMILSPNNNLIVGAIVEIRDEQGRVVRAVKSNALGQFFITTPLPGGSYAIYVEHPDYQFQPLEITLEDRVVDPVEIRSLN